MSQICFPVSGSYAATHLLPLSTSCGLPSTSMTSGVQYERVRFGRSVRQRSAPVVLSYATIHALASWSQLRMTMSSCSTGEEQNPWTDENSPGDLRHTS